MSRARKFRMIRDAEERLRDAQWSADFHDRIDALQAKIDAANARDARLFAKCHAELGAMGAMMGGGDA